jgi:hypothetical protein
VLCGDQAALGRYLHVDYIAGRNMQNLLILIALHSRRVNRDHGHHSCQLLDSISILYRREKGLPRQLIAVVGQRVARI